MDMAMNMGDPDATPASEVAAGELVSGVFALLDTRPSGYDDVAGTADMARHDGGTTVTIELSGLQPGVEYISHLHAEPCSNNGGPHYQFEVGGSEMPPNEIHLLFSADEDGNGFMTAENARTADERAVAIVVHPVDLIDNKIACADF
jgi:Cu/Zn superoxide dismutase